MPTRWIPACALLALLPAAFAHADPLTGLLGSWRGQAIQGRDSTTLHIRLVATDTGTVAMKISIPALHLTDYDWDVATRAGNRIRSGSWEMEYDSLAGRLRGMLPGDLVPVHSIPFDLARTSEEPPVATRAEWTAPRREPIWTIDVGAPVWADLVAAGEIVLVGDDQGRLHAIEASSGKERWLYQAQGAIRGRPTIAERAVYLAADDGFLRRIDLDTGAERWKVRIDSTVVRVPPNQPGSRFDLRGSGALVAGKRLFIGTHGGRLLALDTADGHTLWSADVEGSVLATPSRYAAKVFTGSYGGRIYGFDERDGRQLWSFDTKAPVTSSPVVAAGVLVAGSRSYDLFGLAPETGRPLWNRYVWFSWIESTPAVDAGTIYVGSSDAAKLFAIRAQNGLSLWEEDVRGLAWGQPAVRGDAIYLGTRGSFGGIDHRAAVQAHDRDSGQLLWHFPIERPAVRGPFGFQASPTIAAGRLVLAAVNGSVYAFDISDGEAKR